MSNGFYKTHSAPTADTAPAGPFTIHAFNECAGSIKQVGQTHSDLEAATAEAVRLLGDPNHYRAFFGYVVRDSKHQSVFEARGGAKPGGRFIA